MLKRDFVTTLKIFLMSVIGRLPTMPAQTCLRSLDLERVPPSTPHLPAAWEALLAREDDLPLDPRRWARAEVGRWVSARGGRAERFPMNGKALCLMTAAMFVARVPGHGTELYQDFRRRLAKALALQELIEKMTSK